MHSLSAGELEELAERFGITVRETELEELQATVNGFIDGFDAVDDVPVPSHAADPGERTWSEPDPDDDPYNAVSCQCRVPPMEDHSGLLAGSRVGAKDIIAVAGVPMQCGSDVMQGFIPGTDATVVRRLRDAGASITAKLNLDEFAGSGRGTTSTDGPIRNPHDPDRTTGGSSGGSAAAVAAGQVDIALGTDTGGSIRIPASFCGVVGLKASYGLVPLSGVVENTYTQDHVGPLADTIEETARALEAMAGKDPTDPGSMQAAGHDDYRVGGYVDAVKDGREDDVGRFEIGVLEEGMGDGVTTAVVDRTRAAADRLSDAGASVRDVSVDHFNVMPSVKNVVSFAELAAHWRAGGAPYRRGGVVDEGYQAALASRSATSSGALSTFYKSKLLAGAHLIGADGDSGRRYTRGQAARETCRQAFESTLDDVDALLLPTMADIAPRIENAADPGFNYGRNTRPADVTRLPAITLPNGTVDGLPVGLQLMTGAFEEAHLLRTAATVDPYLEDVD